MVMPNDNFEEDGELDGQLGAPVMVDEPELDVDFDDYMGGRTLGEAEESTEHQSDLQAVLKGLTPKFKNKRLNDLSQPIMVSRIFPDNYLDLNYLLVMSLIEEEEGNSDIDVVGIITGAQVATSIGYEGRGIADRLEIAGVAHEEEYDKLSKELGLT